MTDQLCIWLGGFSYVLHNVLLHDTGWNIGIYGGRSNSKAREGFTEKK